MKAQFEFTKILQTELLGDSAKHVRLEANSDERAALADRFELRAVESLVGNLIIERIKGSELIRVRGRMSAEISQACVVSGKIVVSPIEERVNERFGQSNKTGFEVELSVEEDPPEQIENGEIDLGETIVQYLGVAIDPYPRAPGAEIPQQYQLEMETDVEIRKNPFEVLTYVRYEDD